jgi:hypothetical protein
MFEDGSQYDHGEQVLNTLAAFLHRAECSRVSHFFIASAAIASVVAMARTSTNCGAMNEASRATAVDA